MTNSYFRMLNKRRRRMSSKHRIANIERRLQVLGLEEELKFRDTAVAFTNVVSGVSQSVCVNVVPEGVTEKERVGDDVRFTSVQWKLEGQVNGNRLDNTMYRVIIFWAIQNNNSSTVSVYGDPNSVAPLLDSTALTTRPCLAPYCYQTSDKFRVVYDRVFNMNPQVLDEWTNPAAGTNQAAVEYGPNTNYIHGKFRLHRKTKYTTSVPGAQDIVTNALWLAVVSDSASAGVDLAGVVRVYYKDD